MATKKLAVITGAGSGIGLALVHEAQKNGYRVIGLDNRKEGLSLLSEKFPTESVLGVLADVSDIHSFRKGVMEAIEKAGTAPHLWFNNAGIADSKPFLDTSPESYSRVIDVNLKGTMHGPHLAIEAMKESPKGTIVNISSLAGLLHSPLLASYCASKFGVVGFTRAVQEELRQAHHSIDLKLVLPGFIRTPLIEKDIEKDFPKWLIPLIETPESAAKEVWAAANSNQSEIIITRTGRWMHRMNKVLFGKMSHLSRIAAAKSWKELVGLDPISWD